MSNDVAQKWGERLSLLQARLQDAPHDGAVWQWRVEAKVLCFVLRRYGAHEPVELIKPEISPLERSLLKLSLLIPNLHTKHARPTPRERTAILERIANTGEEARSAPPQGAEVFWQDFKRWVERWGYDEETHQNYLRRCREEAEHRQTWEERRRERLWEERERKRRW